MSPAIDARILGLAAPDAGDVEGRGHALALDRPEDGDPVRVGVLVGAVRERDHLQQGQAARTGNMPASLTEPVTVTLRVLEVLTATLTSGC